MGNRDRLESQSTGGANVGNCCKTPVKDSQVHIYLSMDRLQLSERGRGKVSLPGEGSLILFSGHLGPHDLPLTVQKLERRRRERQRREERSEKRFEAFLYSGHLLLQLDNGNVHYRLPSHRRFTAILQNRLQPGDPVGKRTQPLQLIKHLGLPVSRLLGILRRLIVVGNC